MYMDKKHWLWILAIVVVGVGAFFIGKGVGVNGGAALYQASLINSQTVTPISTVNLQGISAASEGWTPTKTPSTWKYCGQASNGKSVYLSTSGNCWEADKYGAQKSLDSVCAAFKNCSTGATQVQSTINTTR